MQITLRNYLATDRIHDLKLEKKSIEDSALLEARPMSDEEILKVNEIDKKIDYINSHADKTFSTDFIELGIYREYLKLMNDESKNDAEEMARAISFICRVFGNQFTEEEFVRGIAVNKLNETILGVYDDIKKMSETGEESNTQY